MSSTVNGVDVEKVLQLKNEQYGLVESEGRYIKKKNKNICTLNNFRPLQVDSNNRIYSRLERRTALLFIAFRLPPRPRTPFFSPRLQCYSFTTNNYSFTNGFYN